MAIRHVAHMEETKKTKNKFAWTILRDGPIWRPWQMEKVTLQKQTVMTLNTAT
jgi:hypothetical protein